MPEVKPVDTADIRHLYSEIHLATSFTKLQRANENFNQYIRVHISAIADELDANRLRVKELEAELCDGCAYSPDELRQMTRDFCQVIDERDLRIAELEAQLKAFIEPPKLPEPISYESQGPAPRYLLATPVTLHKHRVVREGD